jgi:rubrerythrin
MELNTVDYLKKALLDSQERVRDYMNYSREIDDKELQRYFKTYAEKEGEHAQKLQEYISAYTQ